jgi:hypothetical protein
MTFSASLQPSLPADLADQSNLSTTMFNHIFETFQTQEQLDNSWEVIAQEIDIDEKRNHLERQKLLHVLRSRN